MLIIRKEQLALFSKDMLQAFKSRMVGYISVTFPDWYEHNGKEGAESLFDRSMELATELDMKAQRDIQAIIDNMIRWGDDFELALYEDWAQNILKEPNLSSSAKIQLIGSEIHDINETR